MSAGVPGSRINPRLAAILEAYVPREPKNAEAARNGMRRLMNHLLDLNLQMEAEDADEPGEVYEEAMKVVAEEQARMADPDERRRRAVEAAERKDLEPLRRLYPDLAQFINLPKQPGRGKRFKKNEPLFVGGVAHPRMRLHCALIDLQLIRLIRKRYLDGKRNGPFYGLTAEEIAAERWGLTKVDVIKRRPSRKTLKALKRG